ncbi:MAG TPA: alpha-L-fucosidase [Cyclobacteriaceae bacterium]|nr:alpha-L-fucosidase [Cyclobacteriaceae bacterium]HMV09939.1 alpha-L-fucosidase [Cyclobacteriaceae bacterium]HMV90694.1 alpha-L-fucosidase [Cyclobacteriaceae bacterium]HMX01622.1 alpha-L-fucosidase [Cyclobacteriaceae bacterium]HMX50684.1 alpha-L-fucosidase [Cyclobacteriaceae bacterium]
MLKLCRSGSIASALLLAAIFSVKAQTQYQPTPENLKTREWFEGARFGLFIHWGVYSELGDGEWVMNNQQIPVKTYEKLPAFFNPIEFNPKEWVQMAKDAGMRYITITSKHHDGFAMYDSKVSGYDIVDRTPYKKDVLKMLADECHAQGIKLFFYHSQLDWHHPDYFPHGNTGNGYTGRPEGGDWYKYLDYMDAQLTELLTGYGPIAGIWFDGMWDKKDADWRLEKTYKLIHQLQPAALIGSNHHRPPYEGEDFQMFEKDLPGHNTTGFAPEQKIGDLPKETCETINNSWGFNLRDASNKSEKELIQYLVKSAGYGANFLLNVGPMPNGKIQPEHVALLKQMGAWLKLNGETIYSTKGGPLSARDWGVMTQKGNTCYVHILNWQDETLILPSLGKKVVSAKMFSDKSAIRFADNEFGVTLKIPEAKRNEIVTIIELEIR